MTKIWPISPVSTRAVINVKTLMSDIDKEIEEDKKQHPNCSYSQQLYKKVLSLSFLYVVPQCEWKDDM